MLKLWRRCITRTNKVVIRAIILGAVLVGIVMSSGLKEEVLSDSSLYISHIIIRVSLKGPFMQHFRSSIEESLIIVITLDKVVVGL